jgi:GT2 family glycosyltransferase
MAFSVVIPVSESDDSWKSLAPDLRALNPEDEILFVSSQQKAFLICSDALLEGLRVSAVSSDLGRAKQLNAGARAAKNEFLWFLHCDSRFSPGALAELRRSTVSSPDALCFFDLRFLRDGPLVMKLTEIGTWIRSTILRMPFGDQGFCLSKSNFQKLGGFDERAPYGEDHLLVWKAHQAGVKLKAVGQSLFTSARKYKSNGWAATTSLHLRLTFAQAWPEFVRFLQTRRPL